MFFEKCKLQGCYLIKSDKFDDKRGSFTKTYHKNLFQEYDLDFLMKEQFFTVSAKDVLRGMHFQLPPYDHIKLVTCLTGCVLDVILDLRKSSKTFYQFETFKLSDDNAHILYIPSGIAHGFLSLEPNSSMLYSTSTVHEPKADCGIHWNSFGFAWPCEHLIISERDQQHPALCDFRSPFE